MQYTDLQTETVELVEDDLIFMQMKAWGDLRHWQSCHTVVSLEATVNWLNMSTQPAFTEAFHKVDPSSHAKDYIISQLQVSTIINK